MADDFSDRGARGSRNEETRQRNLSLVLSTVHLHGPQSRADLTRLSGLNRSTVGALVADLVESGLVVEDEPHVTHHAGRPSPVVRPSEDVVAVSVNPDVAGVTFAVVGLGGVVRVRETVLTPTRVTPEDTALLTRDFLTRLASELSATTRVAGVGVAIPGLVNEEAQTVIIAPSLRWADVPLSAILEEELALPAVMANDAIVGVIAESKFGAGVGVGNVVYLNGSTSGLGGGVMSDGRLVKGARGFGTELGHILVDPQGAACPCGRVGCLETKVNARLIWSAAGVDFTPLDDLDYLYADEPTVELERELDRQADALAAGIASLLSVFAPERVILGGHVGALWDARSERLGAGVRRQAFGPLGDEVTIVRNALRERMVPIGSAEMVFRALLKDPVNTPLSPLGALERVVR